MDVTWWEIVVAIGGLIGIADIIRLVIEKLFSNKQDSFARLKERLEFTERETTRLNKMVTRTNMKFLKLYSLVADLIKKSCSKDCPMRELVDIDLDILDEIDENSDDEDILSNDFEHE